MTAEVVRCRVHELGIEWRMVWKVRSVLGGGKVVRSRCEMAGVMGLVIGMGLCVRCLRMHLRGGVL